MIRRAMRRVTGWAAAGLCVATALEGQQPANGAQPLASLSRDFTVGGTSEYTLLLLNLLSARPVPAIIRPIDRSAAHKLLRAVMPDTAGGTWVSGLRWMPPQLSVWVNSARARDDQDGAVWQGRGATAAVTGGLVYERGFFDMAIRPLMYGTQNLAFTPYPGMSLGDGDFRHPFAHTAPFIDLPYRFGPDALASISPGESWARVSWNRVSAGFTAASQSWGPAVRYNLLMGVEAAGYPRAFVDAREVPIGIGHVTLHWSLGRLESSGYSQLPPGERSRVAPAAVASLTLRGLPGVEVGGGRVFHERWTSEALSASTILRPFSELLKDRAAERTIAGNQVAAAFARVAPPGSGVEVYTEFYREDHNANLRDLVGEPDHLSAYVLGFRRAWRSARAVRAITLETANGRISHLQRVRSEPPPYLHHLVFEGHTYLGQALGSSAVFGGGGWSIIADRIEQTRSTSLELAMRRTAQEQEGGVWQGKLSGRLGATVRRARVIASRTHTWSLGVDFGYGRDRAASVHVGHSVAIAPWKQM